MLHPSELQIRLSLGDNFTFMYYDKDHLGNVLSRRYFNVTVTI